MLLSMVSFGLTVTAVPHARRALQNAPPEERLTHWDAMSIESDHRYSAAGAARPLLFWIHRDNVGGARITKRQGPDGALALELLTGSDPARAPFHTNRWGYIREVLRGDEEELVAVKSETDEETLDEARESVNKDEMSRSLVFIRERVNSKEAVAWSTVADVGREVTYRDLEFVLSRMGSLGNWQERRLVRPPNARSGYLIAFNELMNTTVQAVRDRGTSGTGRLPGRLVYIHRAKLYDLIQDQVEVLREFDAGPRGRIPAVRARFRIRNQQTNEISGEYTAVYGVSGELAAVPVRMTYQPRWWLRTELTLDDSTGFSAAAHD